ncbi:MAG: PDZ domain-containing protein [bacterium]
MARYFRLKTPTGVIVTNVKKKSPAANAGMEIGDIIIELNGKSVASRSDIWKIIEDSDLRGGDTLKLVVLRERKKIEMVLRLEEISQ